MLASTFLQLLAEILEKNATEDKLNSSYKKIFLNFFKYEML